MTSAGFSHIANALRERDFAIYSGGNILNHVGTWMQRVTAGWLAWEMTHSATWLGLIGLADMVPILILGPMAGAMADRFDRMRTVRTTQIFIVIFAVVIFLLMWVGALSVELLFLLLFAQGICLSIDQPSRLAMIPALVGKRENLPAAFAINALTFNGARFIGPSVAGFIIINWGIVAAFAWSGVFFGTFVIALMLIRPPAQDLKPSGKNFFAEVADGVTYTTRHQGIGPLIAILLAVSILGRPLISFFPGFATDVFHRGADGLALLTAAVGLGAVFGGFYLAQRQSITGLSKIFLLNIALIAFALIAFASHDIFWLAVPLAGLVGWGLMINGISAQTLIQNAVDSNMRGRVLSLYGMVQRGGQSLGSLVLGVIADQAGFRWTIAGCGILCILLWLWSLRRARTMAETMEN
jgi:MFS family permease